jgi:hypothetical protein
MDANKNVFKRKEENKMKKLNKTGILAGCVALSLAAGAGAAVALYSGTATTKENSYKIVAGSASESGTAGTITESKWDEQKEKDSDGDGVKDVNQMMPSQTFDKDPTLTTAVSYPAVGYILVEIPTIKAQKSGDTEDAVYSVVDTLYNSVVGYNTTNFDLVASSTANADGTNSKYYLFRYKEVMSPANGSTPATTTETIFDQIQVPDFTSVATGQTNLEGKINISAALIQTEGMCTVSDKGVVSGADKADAQAKELLGSSLTWDSTAVAPASAATK